QEAPDQRVALAVEDLDMAACRAGGRYDRIRVTVAIDIAGGDADAAAVAGEGEEAADLRAHGAVEDLDVPARGAGPCPRDNVLDAGPVAVARRHTDAAGVTAVWRQCQAHRAVGVEHADVAGRPCIRRHRQQVRQLWRLRGRWRQGGPELEGAEIDATVDDAN